MCGNLSRNVPGKHRGTTPSTMFHILPALFHKPDVTLPHPRGWQPAINFFQQAAPGAADSPPPRIRFNVQASRAKLAGQKKGRRSKLTQMAFLSGYWFSTSKFCRLDLGFFGGYRGTPQVQLPVISCPLPPPGAQQSNTPAPRRTQTRRDAQWPRSAAGPAR